MELNKNLTNTNRGKGMKTFKQHIKEGSDKTAAAVGSQTTNSVEDGSSTTWNKSADAILSPKSVKAVTFLSAIFFSC